MFKKSKAILALAISLTMSFSQLPVQAQSQPVPVNVSNAGKNEYTSWNRWSKPVQSYLFDNGNGLTRVEQANNEVLVEEYGRDYQLKTQKKLSMELPLWGGFAHMDNGNYLIFGKENSSGDQNAEVLRIVKYSSDWNRIGQAAVIGSNTSNPFEAGSLRCAPVDKMLYILTCHKMVNGHQANWILALDTDSMEVTDNHGEVSNLNTGYVSHSFNQFIVQDGKDLITLNHGDAYPRALILCDYMNLAGEKKLYEGYEYMMHPFLKFCHVIDFPGQEGDNVTNATAGGLTVDGNGYLIVLAYDGANPYYEEMVEASGRNVYAAYIDKNEGLTSVVKLNQGVAAANPMIAKEDKDSGYILWNGPAANNEFGTIYYVSYSKDSYGPLQSAAGSISDCEPILYEGKPTWYSAAAGAPVFYQIDQNGIQAHYTYPLFADISPAGWYFPGVYYAYNKGLMTGVNSRLYQPSAAASRAQTAMVLYRMEGSPQTNATGFPDVDPSAYFAKAAAWARENGLMTGYANGNFGGSDPITREQLAAVFYRYARYLNKDLSLQGDLSAYQDAGAISSYSIEPMKWAVSKKIITGTSPTALTPWSQANRAQLATMLERFSHI